jgi:alpha-tubulin N-acetyltransferase
MKKICFALLVFFALHTNAQDKYKCMVQMTNYNGEAAYMVVSLIDPQGNYQKTLYVFGDNGKYYDSLKKWFVFYQDKKEKIDAVTGASITQGDRKTITLNLDKNLLDQGYKIRFESAVEDQNYYTTDAEVPFSSESLKGKTEGSGYVRYIRLTETK